MDVMKDKEEGERGGCEQGERTIGRKSRDRLVERENDSESR
jgi:hypothetical protein